MRDKGKKKSKILNNAKNFIFVRDIFWEARVQLKKKKNESNS